MELKLEFDERLNKFRKMYGDQFDFIYAQNNSVFGIKHHSDLVVCDIEFFPNSPEPNPGDRTTPLGYLVE